MSLVRCFQSPGGLVYVLIPNWAKYGPAAGETEAEGLARAAARNVGRPGSFLEQAAQWPWADLDSAELPARSALCVECGVNHDVREQWRLVADRVVIDPIAPKPNGDGQHAHVQRERRLVALPPVPPSPPR